MFDEPLRPLAMAISPPRSEFMTINQAQTVSAEQVEPGHTIAETFAQEEVPEAQVVSGQLRSSSTTSPRRSQRGLKRRAAKAGSGSQ